MIDVKTGVIPYTALITGKSKFKKSDKDFSNDDFRIRARLEAENEALAQLSDDIIDFFR